MALPVNWRHAAMFFTFGLAVCIRSAQASGFDEALVRTLTQVKAIVDQGGAVPVLLGSDPLAGHLRVNARVAVLQSLYGFAEPTDAARVYDCRGQAVSTLPQSTDAGSTLTLLNAGLNTTSKAGGPLVFWGGEGGRWEGDGVSLTQDASGIRIARPEVGKETCRAAAGPANAGLVAQGTLDTVCFLMQSRFVDPGLNGLDWLRLCDEARTAIAADTANARGVLAGLVARLATSHTAYLAPDDPMLAILVSVYRQVPVLAAAIKRRGVGPLLQGAGFFTVEKDGRLFIDQVLDGSAAKAAGLRAGDEIVEDEGAAFATAWFPPDSARGDRRTTFSAS